MLDRLQSSSCRIADEIIDCNGQWILPGFVDCHTHLIWAGSKSNEFEMRLSGASYEDITKQGGGIAARVAAVRGASEDELFNIASRRISHFLSRGTTCVEIKSGYGLDLENELKMLAVAKRLDQSFPLHVCPTFLRAHALPPEYKNRPDDYVDLVTNTMLPRIKRQGIALSCDHLEYLCLDRHKGSLETRNDADLVVWDIDAPSDLSYQVGLCLVNKVVIAGKITYNV